jgi:hypothetical protein
MDYYFYYGIQILLAIAGFYIQFVGQHMVGEYEKATIKANRKAELYEGMLAFIFGSGVIAFVILAF